MGGSLGLAAKSFGAARSVRGWARREENRRSAVEGGVVDEAFATVEEAVCSSDLTVLCVPVMKMPELAAACAASARPGAVFTDVGSTKLYLREEMRGIFRDKPAVFVGSHPIAGSERTGMQSATANLYDGAVVVVADAVGGGDTEAARSKVLAFWRAIGSRVVTMTSEEHDRVIAGTSHLPHLVASALVMAVLRDGNEDALGLCGSGFQDTTRVAAGSEAMWHDIVKTNSEAVLRELEGFEQVVARVKLMISSGDFEGLRELLADARQRRASVEFRNNE